eukprot:jgi/Picsp_1/2545/NSC_00776-R1_cox viia-like protein
MSEISQMQKFFQTAQGYVHLKTKGDRVTSVIIPATMAAVAGVYWVQGLYHMYTGTGKLE